MKTLLYNSYEFTLFCDNLFGNPKPFSLLQSLGIRACGTAQRHVTKLVFGNIDNQNAAQGTLRSKEVPTTLVSIWQDSNKVGFCTTIHDGTEQVVRNQKRSKGTSTSAAITKQPFRIFSLPSTCKGSYEHTRLLLIPGAINDYNYYMGRVDIANQLQAGFLTQQRGVKPWRPLFYQLLDSTIINAFRLSEHQRKSKLSGKDKVRSAHQAFREALVSELLKNPSPKALKQVYVTKKTKLPEIRLTQPIEIHQQGFGKQAPCVFCRWSQVTKKGRSTQVITKSQNVHKTTMVCSYCSINLCEDCFTIFHYYIDF